MLRKTKQKRLNHFIYLRAHERRWAEEGTEWQGGLDPRTLTWDHDQSQSQTLNWDSQGLLLLQALLTKSIKSFFSNGVILAQCIEPWKKELQPHHHVLTGRGALIAKAADPGSLNTIRALSGGIAMESNAFSTRRIYPPQTMFICLKSVLPAAMWVNTLKRFELKHHVTDLMQMWPNSLCRNSWCLIYKKHTNISPLT